MAECNSKLLLTAVVKFELAFSEKQQNNSRRTSYRQTWKILYTYYLCFHVHITYVRATGIDR